MGVRRKRKGREHQGNHPLAPSNAVLFMWDPLHVTPPIQIVASRDKSAQETMPSPGQLTPPAESSKTAGKFGALFRSKSAVDDKAAERAEAARTRGAPGAPAHAAASTADDAAAALEQTLLQDNDRRRMRSTFTLAAPEDLRRRAHSNFKPTDPPRPSAAPAAGAGSGVRPPANSRASNARGEPPTQPPGLRSLHTPSTCTQAHGKLPGSVARPPAGRSGRRDAGARSTAVKPAPAPPPTPPCARRQAASPHTRTLPRAGPSLVVEFPQGQPSSSVEG